LKKKCPIVKEECWEHGCEFYTHLVGQNPQTGAPQDEWKCAVSWMPLLLIENAGQTRKVIASSDKVATEVSKQHQTFLSLIVGQAQKRLMDADVKEIENGNNNIGS